MRCAAMDCILHIEYTHARCKYALLEMYVCMCDIYVFWVWLKNEYNVLYVFSRHIPSDT